MVTIRDTWSENTVFCIRQIKDGIRMYPLTNGRWGAAALALSHNWYKASKWCSYTTSVYRVEYFQSHLLLLGWLYPLCISQYTPTPYVYDKQITYPLISCSNIFDYHWLTRGVPKSSSCIVNYSSWLEDFGQIPISQFLSADPPPPGESSARTRSTSKECFQKRKRKDLKIKSWTPNPGRLQMCS